MYMKIWKLIWKALIKYFSNLRIQKVLNNLDISLVFTAHPTEIVRHTIRELQAQGVEFEFLCRIFATAALLLPEDLKAGFERMQLGAPFAMGIKAFPHPVERRLALSHGGQVAMVNPEHFAVRTQDLSTTYYDSGQFCWGTSESFLSDLAPLLTPGTQGVVLPNYRGLDIDDEDDWRLAEAVFMHCMR